eukprot:COSAG06_NODE_3671_length_5036_cov_3.267977_6_plen_81_part_00
MAGSRRMEPLRLGIAANYSHSSDSVGLLPPAPPSPPCRASSADDGLHAVSTTRVRYQCHPCAGAAASRSRLTRDPLRLAG